MYYYYISRKTIVKPLPIRLWIELTSHCNLKCTMCPNKDLPKNKKGFMEFNLFKKIVDEAKDFIFDVSLYHRGESLLHKDFLKFLNHSTKYKWRTKLHTNGTILNDEIIEGIIKSGLYRISFSFDGYEPSTYEKIRIGANFKKVLNNIKKILKIKNSYKKKFPIIAIELIDFQGSEISNRKKREKFLENFKNLGHVEIVIRKIHNWAGYMKDNKGKLKFTPCTFLWHGMVVLWDGTAMPCAQDFFEYYKLENLKDKSIKEIWNSEKLVKLREKHIKKDIMDLETCKNCDRVWRKTFFGVPTEYLLDLLKGKMP